MRNVNNYTEKCAIEKLSYTLRSCTEIKLVINREAGYAATEKYLFCRREYVAIHFSTVNTESISGHFVTHRSTDRRKKD